MVHLNPTDPDLQALTLTVGICHQLTTTQATHEQWDELTRTLATEHTPAELANMLTGACTLLARTPEFLKPAGAR